MSEGEIGAGSSARGPRRVDVVRLGHVPALDEGDLSPRAPSDRRAPRGHRPRAPRSRPSARRRRAPDGRAPRRTRRPRAWRGSGTRRARARSAAAPMPGWSTRETRAAPRSRPRPWRVGGRACAAPSRRESSPARSEDPMPCSQSGLSTRTQPGSEARRADDVGGGAEHDVDRSHPASRSTRTACSTQRPPPVLQQRLRPPPETPPATRGEQQPHDFARCSRSFRRSRTVGPRVRRFSRHASWIHPTDTSRSRRRSRHSPTPQKSQRSQHSQSGASLSGTVY